METEVVNSVEIRDFFHGQFEMYITQFFLSIAVRDPSPGKHDFPEPISKVFTHKEVY